MTTKDETLEALKAENEALKAQLDAEASHSIGWLILTPNKTFEGRTAVLYFRNGHSFIEENKIYPAYVPTMPDDYTLETLRLDLNGDVKLERQFDKEAAIMRESCKVPSSKRLLLKMENDFGYKSEYFGKGEKDKLMDRIKELDEQAEILRKSTQDKKGMADEMMMPERYPGAIR